jgi:hypothetical protein
MASSNRKPLLHGESIEGKNMRMNKYFTLVDGIWVSSDNDFNEPLFAQTSFRET